MICRALTGAWIEIEGYDEGHEDGRGRAFTGAWIEIHCFSLFPPFFIALFTGAWIAP